VAKGAVDETDGACSQISVPEQRTIEPTLVGGPQIFQPAEGGADIMVFLDSTKAKIGRRCNRLMEKTAGLTWLALSPGQGL
jgi:hypothetical protein